jgi:hypothetical protein
MKKSTIRVPVIPFWIVFSVVFVSSCGIQAEQSRLDDIPVGAPLSEFIIGRWKYEGKYYYEGYGYSDIFWEYTFVDEKVITIWTGNDGGTCVYSFIEPEVISIDCSPRMIEQMKWSVKRDNQFLLIQRLDTDELKGGEELKFERVTGR